MGFADDIAKFAAKANANMETIMKRVAFELFRNIVNRTPVDTGRARANWQLGIDKMPTSVVDGNYDDMAGMYQSFVRAKSAIFQVNGVKSIFIINNLEYIIPLEYGTSKQAPQGMVRITVAEYMDYIQEAVQGMN